MDENTSIIIAGTTIFLSKTARTLIEKIADATGWLLAPYQIKRLGKAEDDAAINKAVTDAKVNDILFRASNRLAEEEVKKQANMESILSQTIPQLADGAKPDNLDNDWITNFFDKCRIVSSKEMQVLWAKVLAGEANTPGTYSKRTVNFLQTLEVRDAELFAALCRFVWTIGSKRCPLIFDTNGPIYTSNGTNFESLGHLESIGLINFNSIASYKFTIMTNSVDTHYLGQHYQITSALPEIKINVGKVMLTALGHQLSTIVDPAPINGFADYAVEYWRKLKDITILKAP